MQTKTHHIIALALAFTLPLNIAAAQADPLADLFSNPATITEEAAPAVVEPAAVDTTTVEPASAVVDTVTTPVASTGYLADVVGLAATGVAGGIELGWNAVEGADAYTIHYGPVSIYEVADGIYSSTIELDNVTSYTATGLTADIEYFFAITAEDLAGGTGSEFYSDEASAIPLVASEVTETVAEEPVTSSTAVEVTETVDEPLHGAAPASLPQSGPLTGALLASAVAGAYAWRRRQA